MKHNLKITAIILGMFLLTQFIGLLVQHADVFHIQQEVNGTMQNVSNPQLYWLQPPEPQSQSESFGFLGSLIIAFIIAIFLFFILSKFRIEFILKLWFFSVVFIALFISIYAFEKIMPFIVIAPSLALFIPIIIALPLAWFKIFGRNLYVHNSTELLVYPGIAAIFVPLLNLWTIILLLILISVYDIWAVWHSGFMQKMAKYQINKLNVFSGFFVPYVGKKLRQKIRLMREKAKTSKKAQQEFKRKKIKVNVAILGGGDVIFPIITAGVMLSIFGFLSALFVIVGATLGLAYLFFNSEKKKFYPAMPFITTGIFLALIAYWILGWVF